MIEIFRLDIFLGIMNKDWNFKALMYDNYLEFLIIIWKKLSYFFQFELGKLTDTEI